jgi:hypothetical protein
LDLNLNLNQEQEQEQEQEKKQQQQEEKKQQQQEEEKKEVCTQFASVTEQPRFLSRKTRIYERKLSARHGWDGNMNSPSVEGWNEVEEEEEEEELTLEREYEEQSTAGQGTVGQSTVSVGSKVGQSMVKVGQSMVDDSDEEVAGSNSGSTTSSSPSVEYSDADADEDRQIQRGFYIGDADAGEDSDADAEPLPHWLVFAVTLTATTVFIFTTGHIFYAIENDKFGDDMGGQGWELFDTFWFLVITTTTIGFGDMSLNWNRASATVVEASFISVGLALVALATGMVVDCFQEEVAAVGGAVGEAGEDAQAFVAKEVEETKLAMGKRAEEVQAAIVRGSVLGDV